MSLDQFFASMEPFLFAGADPASGAVERVEAELGASTSGREALDFYRVLVSRNLDKILRDLFPAVYRLACREDGLWPRLVHGYAQDHRPTARDPNGFGHAFSDWLRARREAGEALPAVYEELADYQLCQYTVSSAPACGEGDGFEQRLFLRWYSYAIPELARALARDAEAPIPDPQPSAVVIYRSLREPHGLRSHRPTLPQLAVLAARQGSELPASLAALPEHAREQARSQLVARGILSADG